MASRLCVRVRTCVCACVWELDDSRSLNGDDYPFSSAVLIF